ncbi:MAG: beta-lactamase family protein [Candidatus Schekmanbacteria bacterium]|nr:beta-lactamase family protein [Candidatus Schekmanbacteria bacterium]
MNRPGARLASKQLEQWLRRWYLQGAFGAVAFECGDRHGPVLTGSVAVSEVLGASAGGDEVVWDLASLTKPLVTAMIAAKLIEQGEMWLADKISDYLPLAGAEKDRMTLEHLLCHVSGMPAWKPLYLLGKNRSEVLAALYELPLEAPPGKLVRYSCLGYVLLGEILRIVSGRSLGDLARAMIFAPLGLTDSFLWPALDVPVERIMPTERGRNEERAMISAEQRDELPDWWNGRSGLGGSACLVWGEPHDGNCRHLGGESGNAGMFASAKDLGRYARALLGTGQSPVSRPAIAAMVRSRTPGLEESRGLGWYLATNDGASCGDLLSTSSYGHTGYTGTSLWIDPDRELYYVLLTNRPYAGGSPDTARRLRPRFHSLATTLMQSVR